MLYNSDKMEEAGESKNVPWQSYFLIIWNKLSVEIEKRISSYHDFSEKLKFLLNLKQLRLDEVKEECARLHCVFNADFDVVLALHCLHFKSFLSSQESERQ